MSIENISSNKSFGGWHKQYSHRSAVLNCDMRFAIYLPPQVSTGDTVPVLYWLSGLTCTDENFMQKSGAQAIAAELGIAIVTPDTSPRGDDVADDEGYDLGKGAGFYVNATQAPWNRHYQMYDYIVAYPHRGEFPRVWHALNFRPFNGWPWRTNYRAKKSTALPIGICIQPHQQSDKLPLGAKGLYAVFR